MWNALKLNQADDTIFDTVQSVASTFPRTQNEIYSQNMRDTTACSLWMAQLLMHTVETKYSAFSRRIIMSIKGNTVYYVCVLCCDRPLSNDNLKLAVLFLFFFFTSLWEFWFVEFVSCVYVDRISLKLGTYDYENAGHLNSTSILCANAQTFRLSVFRSLDWPIWIPNVWHQRLICRYFSVCTCSCAKPSIYYRLLKPSITVCAFHNNNNTKKKKKKKNVCISVSFRIFVAIVLKVSSRGAEFKFKPNQQENSLIFLILE